MTSKIGPKYYYTAIIKTKSSTLHEQITHPANNKTIQILILAFKTFTLVWSEFDSKYNNCSVFQKSAIFCKHILWVLGIIKIESYKLYDRCIKNYSCLKMEKSHKKVPD